MYVHKKQQIFEALNEEDDLEEKLKEIGLLHIRLQPCV